MTNGEYWIDFILDRFGDNELFHIEEVDNYVIVHSSNPEIKTQILFLFDNSQDELIDVQFISGKTKIYNRLTDSKPLEFSYDIKQWLENEWLSIPLRKGWKEIEYSIIGISHYKTKVFYDKYSKKSDYIEWHSWIFFFYELITLGSKFADKDIIEVKPMLNEK